MIGEGYDRSFDDRPDPALAKLHTLTLDLAALQRLMSCRDADGALVPVDAALIGTAIGAGYDEVRSMRALLETIPDDPTVAWHPCVEALNGALEKLDIMLSALEAALNRRGG